MYVASTYIAAKYTLHYVRSYVYTLISYVT